MYVQRGGVAGSRETVRCGLPCEICQCAIWRLLIVIYLQSTRTQMKTGPLQQGGKEKEESEMAQGPWIETAITRLTERRADFTRTGGFDSPMQNTAQ